MTTTTTPYIDTVKENQGQGYEYNTPLPLFKWLDNHFHFEIDPCCMTGNNNYLGVPITYTKDQDGLTKEWDRPTFVNPPYGYGNELKWLKKAIKEYKKHHREIFILLPAKTDLGWYKIGDIEADIIILPEGRISFMKDGRSKKGNIFGSVIFGLCDDRHLQVTNMLNDFNDKKLGLYKYTGFQYTLYPLTKKIMEIYK